MNAQGKAVHAMGFVGAIAVLLVGHAAAADQAIVVYGKRTTKPEAAELVRVEPDSIGLHDEIRTSIHNDLRNSLRDLVHALSLELGNDEDAAREAKVASLETRTDV